MRTDTGNEDPELPLLQRICSLELPASEIAAQIIASQSSSNRHISTSIVQSWLCESGLHGRIAAKKPLLKDTNKKKRLAWAKKHEQWTLDWWKSALWSDESKCAIIGSNRRVFVRHRVVERMISTCVPTVKHGGGGVTVWGCFAGDTVRLFIIQGTVNQHGYHSILQQYAFPSCLRLVALSYVFHTPPGCVRAIWLRRRVMECFIRWLGLHNHPTSTQLRWFGMSWTADWRKSSQQVLSICGNSFKTCEAGWENAKSVQSCHQGKGWLLWII